MGRRVLINLFLLVLVGALAFLAYRDLHAPPAAGLPRLTALRPEAIERVRIQDPKGREVLLVRGQGDWRLEEPYRVPAEMERVTRLLPIAETPLRRRFPAQGADLTGFGLAPPQLRLTLDGVEIAFGGTAPTRFRRYVLVGEAVGLIDDGSFPQLRAPAEDFVSHRVLPQGIQVDGARSSLRPLDLNQLLELRADRVEPLTEPAEGVELVVALAGNPEGLTLVLSPDRCRLARPDLGLVYAFREPIPLRRETPAHP